MQRLPKEVQVAFLVVKGIGSSFQASLAVNGLRKVGEYHDLDARMFRSHRTENLQTTTIGQLNIEQYDVRRVTSNAFDGWSGTFEFAHHLRTFDLREHFAQHAADKGGVIDDQD
jgi:hypothetical protein